MKAQKVKRTAPDSMIWKGKVCLEETQNDGCFMSGDKEVGGREEEASDDILAVHLVLFLFEDPVN